MISLGNLWPNFSLHSATAPENAWMPRIRRKLPRIFASLLVALFISSLHAPQARAAQAQSQGTPAPTQKSALDAPARELVRRIAASLPVGTRVTIEVRNQSSLSEDDASALRATMAGELSARGLRTAGEGSAAASVTVTLSENVQGYVWVAQILDGDDSAVLLQSVPRENAVAAAPESKKIVLRKELLWSGPAHILGAAEARAPNGDTIDLFLLELETTTAVITDSKDSFRTELPFVVPGSRDPEAHLSFYDDRITVDFFIRHGVGSGYDVDECVFSTAGREMANCPELRHFPPPDAFSEPPAGPSVLGDQGALVLLLCLDTQALLSSGRGDYTQSDSIAAEAINKQDGLSSPVEFPGPVINLEAAPLDQKFDESTLAIVHNLKNGNYEVYRITAACGN
jgi:hypothetical protein